jgi:hypothetical protein
MESKTNCSTSLRKPFSPKGRRIFVEKKNEKVVGFFGWRKTLREVEVTDFNTHYKDRNLQIE